MTKKVSVLPSCVQEFGLLLTSFTRHCCPDATLELCECLVQMSTAGTLYMGNVTSFFSVPSFKQADDQCSQASPLFAASSSRGNSALWLLPGFVSVK